MMPSTRLLPASTMTTRLTPGNQVAKVEMILQKGEASIFLIDTLCASGGTWWYGIHVKDGLKPSKWERYWAFIQSLHILIYLKGTSRPRNQVFTAPGKVFKLEIVLRQMVHHPFQGLQITQIKKKLTYTCTRSM